MKEEDGSIITKDNLVFKRIKKGATKVEEALVGIGDCSPIKIINIEVYTLAVDGDVEADRLVHSYIMYGIVKYSQVVLSLS